MSDELLSIFWIEVGEHLETLNNVMLQVEMLPPEDKENYASLVREMNRVAHSMKGAARAVGISAIETISHYMEEVFGAAQNGGLVLTPEVADTIYDGLDLIQSIADGTDSQETALSATLARLEQIVIVSAHPREDSQQMRLVNLDGANNRTVDPMVNNATPQIEMPIVRPQDETQEIIPPDSQRTVTSEQARARPMHDAHSMDTSTVVVRPAEETVRVTVSKLDRLMAEVTELFVAQMHSEELQRTIVDLRRMHSRWQRDWRSVRAAYVRLVRRLQDHEGEHGSELPVILRFLETNQRRLTEANRQLSHISQAAAQDTMRLASLADQLQGDIGGMRLVPFESIVGAFQRMVRDLARDMSKQLSLDIHGGHVEIDKAVLDALKDPLIHVLRNSVDHGIEMPAHREAANKSPTGHIVISVQQRGSEIIIVVRDDGRGIDANRVRRSMVKNGLMNEADAAALSDDEVRTYVFYSGLSTSERITNLSGRGLGMDIVRDRVESLRGRVGVQSVPGEGTTITMSVPVSLTRIRCIMLCVGDQTFAIPSAMVTRMGKLDREAIFTTEGHDMLEINGKPMMLASLSGILNVTSGDVDDDKISYVALQATDRSVVFEVDELLSETELVLKPLGPELARARFVSGAALLGSGEIIIILDANDLVRRASGAALPRRIMAAVAAPAERRLRVLVVDDSITTRTLEKNILETAGFDVYVAIDGVEAWSMLPQNDYDVVISDVEMPNMTGLELTARIKASAKFQHIPVVLLTSLGKPEQREAGLRAGANAYLVKSKFDQGELLRTIQSVVAM